MFKNKNKKFFFKNSGLLVILLIVFFSFFAVFKQEQLISNSLISKKKVVDCNTLSLEKYNDFNKNLSSTKINIITKNSKKWTVNELRAYMAHRKGNFIQGNFKKRFTATVFLTSPNGLSCKLKSKIRLHGDLFDHLDPLGGNPSLDVRLDNSHIINNTKFKLFKPITRNYENEIFSAILLRHMGFLAPRTFLVNVSLNGNNAKYIFQEGINKEFLENSSRREGPILEGDERFEWCLWLGTQFTNKNNKDYKDAIKCKDFTDKRQTARITNSNWAKKGLVSTYISINAISKMNEIYLINGSYNLAKSKNNLFISDQHTRYPEGDYFSYLLRKGINSNGIKKNKIPVFDALMYAMNGSHGLHMNDRKFYFDPVDSTFEPIYYDGMTTIDGLVQSVEKIDKIQKINIDKGIYTQKGAETALKELKAINIKKLLGELNISGVNITEDKLKKLLNDIKIKLSQQINYEVKIKNIKMDLNPAYSKINDNYKKIVFLEKKDLLNNNFINENGIIKVETNICDLNGRECSYERHSIEKLSKILSQRYTDNKKIDYIFIREDLNEYLFPNTVEEYLDKMKNQKKGIASWSSYDINLKSKININSGIDLIIEKENKKIIINQTNPEGRAVIFNDKIENWEIIFNGYKNNFDKQNQRFTTEGLTGCVTFMDIKVKNLKINSNNSICEDAINFIRTNGSLSLMELNNNKYDGVDADFSTLKFEKVIVSKAGNDCFDLSFGSYSFNNSFFSDCYDKAVSVGEKSNALFNKISIEKSELGIASKDSSKVKVIKAEIKDVSTCLSAYRKKDEFSGALISVNEIKCSGRLINKEIGSEIMIAKTFE
tara:strand:- start:199 stop:2688 length:2490 start_codon:yes stop_codon:yes gene_type:complete